MSGDREKANERRHFQRNRLVFILRRFGIEAGLTTNEARGFAVDGVNIIDRTYFIRPAREKSKSRYHKP